jgi:hypothetical protein
MLRREITQVIQRAADCSIERAIERELREQEAHVRE